MQLMSVSSSYETKDFEAGGKKDKNLFKDFRNKSTVTLKSIARTLSGPVGETPSSKARQDEKNKAQLAEELPSDRQASCGSFGANLCSCND